MQTEAGDAIRQVLLVQNDTGYRSALAHELRQTGLEVVDVPTTMRALDVLDRSPRVGFAIVASDMQPNTLNAIAFARMMKYRNIGAQIVLLIGKPGDLPPLDGPDADLFDGIVVKRDDMAAAMSGILFLFGLDVARMACHRG